MPKQARLNHHYLWLTLTIFLSGCAGTLGVQKQQLSTQTTPGSQYILATLVNDGQAESNRFKGFGRSYRPPSGYGSTLAIKRKVDGIIDDYGLLEGPGWQINSLKIYCVMLQIPTDKPAESVIAALEKDQRIETVQQVFDYAVEGKPSYNDPYFSMQYKEQASVIEKLHRNGTGAGINIAVIDTGVDTKHPDLSHRIHRTRNFVDNNQQRFLTDIHGTAVTGIIVAQADNAFGIVGLAPGAEVAALKACWQLDEQSSIARCNSFTLASALSDAIDHQADIVNISLSGPKDPLVARLVQTAISRGIIVVASDPAVGASRYPARLSGVIKVKDTSRQSDESIAQTTEPLAIFIDGKDVLTTGPGGHFDFFSGSSMSAAMVSGLSALMLEQNAQLDAEALLLKLKETIATHNAGFQAPISH